MRRSVMYPRPIRNWRRRRSRRRRKNLKNGKRFHRRPVRGFCSVWLRCCASARSTSSPPRWSTRSAKRGRRPTPTPPRRSTSGVLRAGDASLAAAADHQDSRRGQRAGYIPLGVGAVIPPWNFPLAIMAGMTTRRVVAGNCVVLKPSSDAPWIAWRFFELLEEAGLPPGVVNFVQRLGRRGRRSARQHPAARFISFTGSKEVGLHINEVAAKRAAGPDLDQARGRRDGRQGRHHRRRRRPISMRPPTAVVASAFGFQGQKCSACSRAIVDEDVYDELVRRGRREDEAADGRRSDDRRHRRSARSSNENGDEEDQGVHRQGKEEGRAGGRRRSARRKGFFVEPTVIADVAPDAPHRPGGDLRPGAGGHQGEGLRRRAAHRQRHGISA